MSPPAVRSRTQCPVRRQLLAWATQAQQAAASRSEASTPDEQRRLVGPVATAVTPLGGRTGCRAASQPIGHRPRGATYP
ncbi:hypothetical protein EBN03_32630 [Nocardia stercoris]|uniref:Uncharacterized protein n=1 Tax=Nocardia stercoris TaxID=2483361 RepID=A0A3M2KQF3_9NOCA|nr:hypothetical protein EBN03_32630 [Nocardia stercoris]